MAGAGLLVLWTLVSVMPAATPPAEQMCVNAPAEAAQWKIVAASGRSESRLGPLSEGSWSRLRRGGSLAPLTTVRTFEKARATFTRAGDLILLDASSEVLLPEITPAGMTVVIQKSGTALYKVAPGSAERRFEVRTPYLVAGVKGTRFTVQMEEGRTAVNVLEGVVEVLSLLTGETRDLVAGEIALVDGHEGRMEMQRDPSGTPDAGVVKPLETVLKTDEPVLTDLRSASLDLDSSLEKETTLLRDADQDLWSDLSDDSITLIDTTEDGLCVLSTRLDPTSQDVKTDTTILDAIPLIRRK